MDIALTNQFFNLAKSLVMDGFSVDLSFFPSKVNEDYSNFTLVINVVLDERLIKLLENRIEVNLGCDYEISRNDYKNYVTLIISSL